MKNSDDVAGVMSTFSRSDVISVSTMGPTDIITSATISAGGVRFCFS
ncbi:hypothetical protein [Oceaniglobus indicus]|nr:hypothetical protein [Oceaniglobus indicus]